MVDFVPLVEDTYWPTIPGPTFINNSTSPVTFIQDESGLDKVNRKESDTEGGSPKDRYKRDPNDNLLSDSLQWPITAAKDKCAMPFITAGVVAFLIVPAVDATAGIGGTLAFAYFAAAAESPR